MADYRIKIDKHNTADFKDQEIEKLFFGLLLRKPQMFENIVNDFKLDYFSNSRLRRIFNAIKIMYDKDGIMCNDISVIDTINAPDVKLEAYRVLWKKCLTLAPKVFKQSKIMALKEKLRQLYDARFIEIGIADSLKVLQQVMRGDTQSADKVHDIFEYIVENTGRCARVGEVINPVSNFNVWMRNYERKQKNPQAELGIPTGIVPIDNVISGLKPPEFGLAVMGTGVGKSIFMLDCGVYCWEKMGDNIYITIEMSKEQLENRFWCNLSGIKNEKFRRLTMNAKDKEILKHIAQRKIDNPNKFHIIDMKQGCTVNEIVNSLNPYLRKKTHNVKLIEIDYLNIISSEETGAVSLDWQSQVANAMNIKQKIARRFGIPTWSAVQVTGDRVAFGTHIIDNIDIGVQMEETEDTQDTDILEVSYIKTRDFKPTPHVLKVDRDRMTMYAPGAETKVRRLEQFTGTKIKRKD